MNLLASENRKQISPISDMPDIGDFKSLAKIDITVAGTPGDFHQSPHYVYKITLLLCVAGLMAANFKLQFIDILRLRPV